MKEEIKGFNIYLKGKFKSIKEIEYIFYVELSDLSQIMFFVVNSRFDVIKMKIRKIIKEIGNDFEEHPIISEKLIKNKSKKSYINSDNYKIYKENYDIIEFYKREIKYIRPKKPNFEITIDEFSDLIFEQNLTEEQKENCLILIDRYRKKHKGSSSKILIPAVILHVLNQDCKTLTDIRKFRGRMRRLCDLKTLNRYRKIIKEIDQNDEYCNINKRAMRYLLEKKKIFKNINDEDFNKIKKLLKIFLPYHHGDPNSLICSLLFYFIPDIGFSQTEICKIFLININTIRKIKSKFFRRKFNFKDFDFSLSSSKINQILKNGLNIKENT